jgi:hypothetical protein
VRCSVDVLNALKEEFDRHPIKLHPDKAVSQASVGKSYLPAMNIVPPMEKFNLPDDIQGIAAQAFFGGRAECGIRKTPVPVVVTDFSSQHPHLARRRHGRTLDKLRSDLIAQLLRPRESPEFHPQS